MTLSGEVLSVNRAGLAALLSRARAYPELSPISQGLQTAGVGAGPDRVDLQPDQGSQLRLLIDGISLRTWNPYGGSALPDDKALWGSLGVSLTPLSAPPPFYSNPDWPLRLREKLRPLFSKLVKSYRQNLSHWRNLSGQLESYPKLTDKAGTIAARLKQTEEELRLLYRLPDESYAEALLERSHLLEPRMIQLARTLTDARHEGQWKLDFNPKKRPFSRDAFISPDLLLRIGPGNEPVVGRRLPSLENQPIEGLPPNFLLRRHQRRLLSGIRTDIQRSIDDGEKWEGTVIAPTGSGKTRVMTATILMAAEEWGLNFSPTPRGPGDKILFTTHLKIGVTQLEKEIAEFIVPWFREKYGRDPVITYATEGGMDFTGDFVIASIPTLKEDFESVRQKLREALGPSGRIPLCMMDEFHHVEAPTWQDTMEMARTLCPDTYILGFTATPTGTEPNPIKPHLKPYPLIRQRVLPNLELVEARTKTCLDSLRTREGEEFEGAVLSRAINNKERNEDIFKALEEHGATRQGRNKLGLAPTLIFGADLPHIMGLANFYRDYFTETDEGCPLKGRTIRIIGATDSGDGRPVSMKIAETRRSIEDYKQGRVDALVAVVWGHMDDVVRELIEEEFRAGNIEAVVNCRTWHEMFDAPFLRNLVGARPALKALSKHQEAGRITRYGKDEVDDDGRILRYERRVVIDVIDDLKDGRHLQTYREAYGVPYTLKTGKVYSLTDGRPKDETSPTPNESPAPPERPEGVSEEPPPTDTPPKTPVKRGDLSAGVEALLRERFGGRFEEALSELGIDLEEVLDLLEAEPLLRERQKRIRWLATLLYLRRNELDPLFFRHIKKMPDHDEVLVVELLRTGLEIYLQLEDWGFDLPDKGAEFTVNFGGRETEQLTVTRQELKKVLSPEFEQTRLLPELINRLALGLSLYLSRLGGKAELAGEIIRHMDILRGGRLAWNPSLQNLSQMTVEDFEHLSPDRLEAVKRSGEVFWLVAEISPSGRFTLPLRFPDYESQRSFARPAESGVPLAWRSGHWQLADRPSGPDGILLARTLIRAGIAVPSAEMLADEVVPDTGEKGKPPVDPKDPIVLQEALDFLRREGSNPDRFSLQSDSLEHLCRTLELLRDGHQVAAGDLAQGCETLRAISGTGQAHEDVMDHLALRLTLDILTRAFDRERSRHPQHDWRAALRDPLYAEPAEKVALHRATTFLEEQIKKDPLGGNPFGLPLELPELHMLSVGLRLAESGVFPLESLIKMRDRLRLCSLYPAPPYYVHPQEDAMREICQIASDALQFMLMRAVSDPSGIPPHEGYPVPAGAALEPGDQRVLGEAVEMIRQANDWLRHHQEEEESPEHFSNELPALEIRLNDLRHGIAFDAAMLKRAIGRLKLFEMILNFRILPGVGRTLQKRFSAFDPNRSLAVLSRLLQTATASREEEGALQPTFGVRLPTLIYRSVLGALDALSKLQRRPRQPGDFRFIPTSAFDLSSGALHHLMNGYTLLNFEHVVYGLYALKDVMRSCGPSEIDPVLLDAQRLLGDVIVLAQKVFLNEPEPDQAPRPGGKRRKRPEPPGQGGSGIHVFRTSSPLLPSQPKRG